MPVAINKILLSLSIILVLTLFIGINAIDVAYPDHFVQSNQDHDIPGSVHYIGKRRFLPTRRELYQYINGDVSDEDEEDKSYLNTKRYFLKSKRYFLNSKRDNERQEE